MRRTKTMHLAMALILALLVGGVVLANTDTSLTHHITYADGSVVRS